MIDFQPLKELSLAVLQSLIQGYQTLEKYEVVYQTQGTHIEFKLQLITLNQPFKKSWQPDQDSLELYQGYLPQGYSWGAFKGEQLVGILLAEKQDWNKSLLIWEFHVLPNDQGQGIGKKLMATVEAKARQDEMRVLVCETQNTNVPAIQIYHKLGFQIEGIDLSYYSNEDYPKGEIALFMKKHLT